MKTTLFQILCTALITLSLTAFTTFSLDDLTFEVQVQGVENKNLLKEGLQPAELALMTIESNDEKVSIEKFEVILARGSRPVSEGSQTVSGKQFDLATFAEQARAGDRIVIEIMELSTAQSLDNQSSIITIPIK